ncbi:Rv3235 family protein [Falsarthrobacter nasiphocae]|uniref:Uncharacterized protein n=1 Tax=Falsarthrobacter nasiphocae TaxID=189863 RepID=A0AAE3YGL1_9MICC|nr:Rv3235 family protein [Falsarthrobacter nasiphocae]MDR6891421.1 hypothetical protein [Falsarthrobacter nasiphocae]
MRDARPLDSLAGVDLAPAHFGPLGRVFMADPGIPPEVPATARAAACLLLDIFAGARPARHLERGATAEVTAKVAIRTALMLERRDGRAQWARARFAGPAFGSTAIHAAGAGAYEATILFHDGRRVRACAMRLEYRRLRWTITELELG